MQASGSFQSGKGVGIRAVIKLYKINVPVLRRDLIRIKLNRPAWDKVHKDSIRAALMPGRGARTVREKLQGPYRPGVTRVTREKGLCQDV
eukprot:530116-Pelagomonas_calceolata.AAC.1